MADESNPDRYLIFFLTLAAITCVSLPVTWLVSDDISDKDDRSEMSEVELKMTADDGNDGKAQLFLSEICTERDNTTREI